MYYYNPSTERFHKNILIARNRAIHHMKKEGQFHDFLSSIRAEHLSLINNDRWCTEHPEIIARWLNLIPTYTRMMLEVQLHEWAYRLIHADAGVSM